MGVAPVTNCSCAILDFPIRGIEPQIVLPLFGPPVTVKWSEKEIVQMTYDTGSDRESDPGLRMRLSERTNLSTALESVRTLEANNFLIIANALGQLMDQEIGLRKRILPLPLDGQTPVSCCALRLVVDTPNKVQQRQKDTFFTAS